jgi:6-phosphogluconolactonase
MAEPPVIVGGQQWLLIGTGTDQGIYRTPFDPGSGVLGNFEVAVQTPHPTYLAVHPTLPLLYAANETPDGDGQISSFKLERANANLTELAQASTEGKGACYVSLDHTGRMVFAANYGGGSVVLMDIVSDGEFDNTQLFDCKTNLACGRPGPIKVRQDGPHMHCAVVSPDNRFVLACDLGGDGIEIFPFTPKKPKKRANWQTEDDSKPQPPQRGPTRVSTRIGSGPRHVAFHPDGHLVYCIHELDCTLQAFNWSVREGAPVLEPIDNTVISTLPKGMSPMADSTKPNTGCELSISPNGKSLYANTRGVNTLAVYDIDTHTGILTEQQRINTGGDTTRHFAFDPSRRWLLCANQGSSTITVFSHDLKTGKLGDQPKSYPIDTPMFVQFI